MEELNEYCQGGVYYGNLPRVHLLNCWRLYYKNEQLMLAKEHNHRIDLYVSQVKQNLKMISQTGLPQFDDYQGFTPIHHETYSMEPEDWDALESYPLPITFASSPVCGCWTPGLLPATDDLDSDGIKAILIAIQRRQTIRCGGFGLGEGTSDLRVRQSKLRQVVQAREIHLLKAYMILEAISDYTAAQHLGQKFLLFILNWEMIRDTFCLTLYLDKMRTISPLMLFYQKGAQQNDFVCTAKRRAPSDFKKSAKFVRKLMNSTYVLWIILFR